MQTVQIPDEEPKPVERRVQGKSSSDKSRRTSSARQSEVEKKVSDKKESHNKPQKATPQAGEAPDKVNEKKSPRRVGTQPIKTQSDAKQKRIKRRNTTVVKKEESKENRSESEREKSRDEGTREKKNVIAPKEAATHSKRRSQSKQESRERNQSESKNQGISAKKREEKPRKTAEKVAFEPAPSNERNATLAAPAPPPTGSRASSAEISGQPGAEPSKDSPVRGVEHDLSKRWTAYYLGISLAIVGLINLSPAVFEIVDYYNPENIQSLPVPRWAYVVLCVGAIQIFYAIYLAQLPDWSSVWVVAVLTLMIASAYALLLGIVWLGDGEGRIVTLLELTSHIRKKATLWCFSMMSVTSCLTYFCGREGVRWYRTHAIQANTPAAT